MRFSKIRAFLRLTRPFFLLGGILLYLLGVSIALSSGAKFNPADFWMGQFLVTSIQLMVQYANEYYDLEVDGAEKGKRTWFSGGSGVLPGKELGPRVALRAAQVCAGISLLLLVMAARQTPAMGIIGAWVLLAAWFYSAPPLRLVSSGWGELTASMILAFFVPLTGMLLQPGLNTVPRLFLVICPPLVLIHMAMLIAFEFPDQEADAAFGKQTLTVRLGLGKAVRLHDGLIFGAFILYAVFALGGITGKEGRFVFLALPLAAWQMVRIEWHLRHRQAQFHWLTMGAVGLFGLTAILWLLGFLF